VELQRNTKRKTPSLPWLRQSAPDSAVVDRQLQWAELTDENAQYMRRILAEIGWIDVPRFGYSTSKAAFLIVQHSWDIPLMLSVLPRLQEDVKADRIESEEYALMYDRVHLALGYPQRYGSQVITEESGDVLVLPVEEPGRVESLRRELGLIPLIDYVRIFGATKVRFSQACREQGSA
jgi:hypothetical protein